MELRHLPQLRPFGSSLLCLIVIAIGKRKREALVEAKHARRNLTIRTKMHNRITATNGEIESSEPSDSSL